MKSTRTMAATLGLLLLAASVLHADEAEYRAVEAVQRVGGKVIRDEKAPSQPVIAVDLVGSRVRKDADLKGVGAPLGRLRETPEAGPSERFQITDAGLKELAPLTQLRTLELLACRVTGTGLKELAPLEHVESLSLKRTTITDAGLKELAAFKELRNLTCLRVINRTTLHGVQNCGW